MNRKLLAPLITISATWAVKRGLETGYRLAFGDRPPAADDTETRLLNAVAWAVTTAGLVAVVEVLVTRAFAPAPAPAPAE